MESLNRFKEAQKEAYSEALKELQNGRKKSHWMWYIFPQIKGLGHSTLATYYAIEDMGEAIAYLEDEELYSNLVTLCEVLINLDEQDATKIFGTTDAMKLKSSMTLFSYAADFAETRHLQEESNGMPNLFDKSSKYRETDQIFDQVLDKFYDDQKDYSTEEILFFERPRLEMETFTPKVHK